MPVKVLCPNCQAAYNVREDKLGQTIACKRCSKPFKLETESECVDVEEIEEKPAVALTSAPTEEPKPQGFWSRLKSAGTAIAEAAEKVKQEKLEREQREEAEKGHPPVYRMLVVTFLTGPLDVKLNTGLYFHVTGENMLLFDLTSAFSSTCREVLRIGLKAIKHTEVETADRMTLARTGAGLLLGGPIGAAIVGFGFKKKDKFLRIDFDDAGMETSVVFGGSNVETVNNKILSARREVLRSQATQGEAAS